MIVNAISQCNIGMNKHSCVDGREQKGCIVLGSGSPAKIVPNNKLMAEIDRFDQF